MNCKNVCFLKISITHGSAYMHFSKLSYNNYYMSIAHGSAYMHYSKLSQIEYLDSKTEFF